MIDYTLTFYLHMRKLRLWREGIVTQIRIPAHLCLLPYDHQNNSLYLLEHNMTVS